MPLDRRAPLSQSRLQDYLDCPRRFELRHILRQPWPAIPLEPVLEVETHRAAGERFHKLLEQWFAGLPEARLAATIAAGETELAQWWQAFLQHRPHDQHPGDLQTEHTLAATLDGFRLIAKYDLLIIQPGRSAVIFDWKTTRFAPRRDTLQRKIQTAVYPFVLVEAGAHLNGGQPIDPDHVRLHYWFPAHPDQPVRFDYSASQHAQTRADLSALLAEIDALEPGQFLLTTDEHRCRFCEYRSLCGRGVTAGSIDDLDSEPTDPVDLAELDLNLDQIAEIAF